MKTEGTDPKLSSSQALQLIARAVATYEPANIERLCDVIYEVGSAIREASGRDKGDIGFVGEIALALQGIATGLNRMAQVAEDHFGSS